MTTRFRPLCPGDRERILAISARIWEGSDFLGNVFDRWIREDRAYFAGIEVDGVLAGCGRLLPFDSRRAWLEALRVDPDMQGRGLGRAMAHHLFATGRDRGFAELWFSTYFENTQSIHVSEAAGFQRVATYSTLELGLSGEDREPFRGADAAVVTESSSLPDVDAFFWNDWLFVPPLPDRASWFPAAATFTCGYARLVVSENTKVPECLEISWVEGAGEELRACLARAVSEARRRGSTVLHVMLPSGVSSEIFKEVGFTSFQREGDVFLYRVATTELRLRNPRPGDVPKHDNLS